MAADLEAKRLELLHEMVQTAVGMLVNPNSPDSEAQSTQVDKAALALRLQDHTQTATPEGEIDAAFATLTKQRIGALSVASDALILTRRVKLEFPAVREKGDTRVALWPGKYPLRRLEETRVAIGERDWSALYQQKPAPDEGVYFKREWFNWYDEPPQHLTKYGASDYAVKGKSGDWTVHVVAGVDPEDNLYVVDLWRKQTTSDVWIDAFLDLIDQHKPMVWAEEDGQIIKSLGPLASRARTPGVPFDDKLNEG